MSSQDSLKANSEVRSPPEKEKLLIEREVQVTQILFMLRWRSLTQILLALPVVGMFICLITSLIFHADHINNTICDVYNFLPSISAVTGVSPQRYLWRVCVALHISPRLLVAWVAKEFYSSLASKVPEVYRPAFQGLVTIAFFLNVTELVTLCGVTYISNKENYPVHEKLFMLFMIASLVYMVCVVRLLQIAQDSLPSYLLRSLAHKKWLLGTKIVATVALIFFFYRHRVHCQPKAFSWFSLSEYVIATCNMLYHVSVALDFSEEHLIVGRVKEDKVGIDVSVSSNTASIESEHHLDLKSNKDIHYKLSQSIPVDKNPLMNDISPQDPPEDLDLVPSSSCYNRLSGLSNSSSGSPCLTDISSDSSFTSGSSTGSSSSSQEADSSTNDAAGINRQVLTTIPETSESATQKRRLETSESIVKERLVSPSEDTGQDVLTKDVSSSDIKTKDLLSFPLNPQKFSCLDKTHLE